MYVSSGIRTHDLSIRAEFMPETAAMGSAFYSCHEHILSRAPISRTVTAVDEGWLLTIHSKRGLEQEEVHCALFAAQAADHRLLGTK
jgi:hypothetical protein